MSSELLLALDSDYLSLVRHEIISRFSHRGLFIRGVRGCIT